MPTSALSESLSRENRRLRTCLSARGLFDWCVSAWVLQLLLAQTIGGFALAASATNDLRTKMRPTDIGDSIGKERPSSDLPPAGFPFRHVVGADGGIG